ncbi:unnamed protein product, partial [Prorocentrum cordatum]
KPVSDPWVAARLAHGRPGNCCLRSMAREGGGVARPRRSPGERKAARSWARHSADRAARKLSEELAPVESELDATAEALEGRMGGAEAAGRVRAILPAPTARALSWWALPGCGGAPPCPRPPWASRRRRPATAARRRARRGSRPRGAAGGGAAFGGGGRLSLSADAVPLAPAVPFRAWRVGGLAEPAFSVASRCSRSCRTPSCRPRWRRRPCAAQLTAVLPDREEKGMEQKASLPVMMKQPQISEPFDGGMEISEADKAGRGRADLDGGSSLPCPAAVPRVPCGLPLGPRGVRLVTPALVDDDQPDAVGDDCDPLDAFDLGGFRL